MSYVCWRGPFLKMRKKLYQFHLIKDGSYTKKYYRIASTEELNEILKVLKEQGYEILSVE